MALLDSHEWQENIPCPMPARQVRKWQTEINKLFGLAPDGQPYVRLAWGADLWSVGVWSDESKQMVFPFEMLFGSVMAEKRTPGGLILREWSQIGAPRFFLGYWQAPQPGDDQLRRAWVLAAYQPDPRMEQKANDAGVRFFGSFRMFSECDLNRLRQMKRDFLASAPAKAVDRPMDAAWMAEIEAAQQKAKGEAERHDLAINGPLREKAADAAWQTAGIITDPGYSKMGSHHFLGGHNATGTPAQKENS